MTHSRKRLILNLRRPMPCASYQCSSTRPVQPSRRRTVAIPLSLRHRPRPNWPVKRIRSRTEWTFCDRFDIDDFADDLKIHSSGQTMPVYRVTPTATRSAANGAESASTTRNRGAPSRLHGSVRLIGGANLSGGRRTAIITSSAPTRDSISTAPIHDTCGLPIVCFFGR